MHCARKIHEFLQEFKSKYNRNLGILKEVSMRLFLLFQSFLQKFLTKIFPENYLRIPLKLSMGFNRYSTDIFQKFLRGYLQKMFNRFFLEILTANLQKMRKTSFFSNISSMNSPENSLKFFFTKFSCNCLRKHSRDLLIQNFTFFFRKSRDSLRYFQFFSKYFFEKLSFKSF